MNSFCVLFNGATCILQEAKTAKDKINELQLESNDFTTSCHSFLGEFIPRVEEGNKILPIENSKTTIRTFLTQTCFPFISSVYEYSFDYLENLQTVLGEHIAKVESGEYAPGYQEELTALEDSFTNNKTCIINCKEEFDKMNEESDGYVALNVVLPQHRLMVPIIFGELQRFYEKQILFIEKG